MKVDGTIVYIDLEDGFWGIEGDDGKKYCPVEMPAKFRKKGQRVRATMTRAQIMSIRMWGIDVEIEKLEAL